MVWLLLSQVQTIKNQIEYAISPNLEWNERFSLKNSRIYALDVVERIKN